MARDDDRRVVMRDLAREQRELGVGVALEMVDRDDAGQAEVVADVVDVPLEIRDALLERRQALLREVADGDAAVELERAHRCDEHDDVGSQAGLAALDVDELLGAQVGAEAGFGDDDVGKLPRRLAWR